MTLSVMTLQVIDIRDVPRGLRAIADAIEAGKYGAAHNLAWAIDCGDDRVECGLLGASATAGAEAHLLFAIAQRKLELARE